MKSTSETGHAVNVSNLENLVTLCTGYGTAYNPSKTSIKLAALQALLASAKNSITVVNAALPAYANAVAAREAAFIPVNKLVTRIINALKATDAPENVIENAKTLARKIQGTRAKPKLTDEEKKTLAAAGKEVKEISASQMSYDNRLDNFDKLIKLLTSITLYAPNEADLKVAALNTLYTDLKAKNTAVIAAYMPLSNARIARNEVLYKKTTGMYDIVTAVKSYIKSVYTATSPQYKQVSSLKFTKPR